MIELVYTFFAFLGLVAPGASFTMGDVIAYNADREFVEVGDPGAIGIVGYAGNDFSYDSWEDHRGYASFGYLKLANDDVDPVPRSALYTGTVCLKDSMTVSSDCTGRLELLRPPMEISVDGTQVLVYVGPPHSH